MSQALPLLLSVLRALTEVAGLALLGQGILHVLAGAGRERNPIYRLFRLVARPAVATLRRILPAAILDRHLPVLTFFVLLWLWIALAWLRQAYCTDGACV